jgi:AcrR family transcriptional regulator
VSVEERQRPPRRRGAGRPRRADPDETRARILQRARESFALHGFADTPVDAVATDAGVTSGTMYYYFGSKVGLYEAVANDALERLNAGLIDPVLAVTSGQSTAASRLTTLVNVLAHRAGEDAWLHRLGFASDIEAEHIQVVKDFRDRLRRDLDRLYAGVAGVVPRTELTRDELQLVRFIELLTLGMWQFAIRPGGLERLPIFVQAFDKLLSGTLFGEAEAQRRRAVSRARR